MQKITSFTDLITWKEGHKLILQVYQVTDTFPKNAFSLIDQMRRASVSITSNVAEGFSRKSSKEKIQFYYMSLGSLTELQNKLIISKDLKYIRVEKFNALNDQTVLVHKLLFGLIKSLRTP